MWYKVTTTGSECFTSLEYDSGQEKLFCYFIKGGLYIHESIPLALALNIMFGTAWGIDYNRLLRWA
jgi:hypothetical protein